MNYFAVTGRLTRDPEYGSGSTSTYLRFDIAVDRTDSDEADFVKCVLFGKIADSMNKYLRKGRLIFISGRNQSSNYLKDGQKRRDWTLYGEKIELLDRPSSTNPQVQSAAGDYQDPWSDEQ